MSNVTISASGAEGLEVDVCLGPNVRKTHAVPSGESVVCAVGGGQVLSVRSASNVAPTAEALPVGADVDEFDVTPGGEDDCGDGTGRTNLEKAADDEAAAAEVL